jgi:hypothetical protein
MMIAFRGLAGIIGIQGIEIKALLKATCPHLRLLIEA